MESTSQTSFSLRRSSVGAGCAFQHRSDDLHPYADRRDKSNLQTFRRLMMY